MTGGNGPDSCIEAVGMEAHSGSFQWYDKAKQTLRLETDRPQALREAILACRKGGTVSVPGVYGGFIDKVPMGAAFNKGLTLKMGQTHTHRYMRPLLERIEKGEIDPSRVISHRMSLDEGPDGYEIFKHKQDECIKIVLTPGGGNGHLHTHPHHHGPNGGRTH
jgi:threonine dehydrogenase-like Zn-dependent dehydrogenase